MAQVLFVVDIPAPGLSTEALDGPTKWFGFEAKLKSNPLPSGCKKLPCRNAWLLPVEQSAQGMTQLSSLCNEFGLSHSAFLVSGEITPMQK